MGKTRPTCVTVLGVLNIIFGAFGLLIMTMLTGLLAVLSLGGGLDGHPRPFLELLQEPLFWAWMLGSIAGLTGAVVLVAAGIGLLKMKAWARTASIILGICGVLLAIVAIPVSFLMRGPAVGMAHGLAACIGLMYALVLLMFRRDVVEAFRPASTRSNPPPGPADGPDARQVPPSGRGLG